MRTNQYYIGCSGFAQFKADDYHERSQVERDVLMEYVRKHCPVPDEFAGIAWFAWIRNPYDDSAYYDLQVKAYQFIENKAEDSDENMDRYDRFMDWINKLESLDLESEEILNKCASLYHERYGIKIVYRKDQEGELQQEKMKIV